MQAPSIGAFIHTALTCSLQSTSFRRARVISVILGPLSAHCCTLIIFRTYYQLFPIVKAMHYRRTLHAMTSLYM